MITVTEPNHGRSSSDTVRFYDASSFDGITATNLTRSAGYTITKVDDNSYTFTVATDTATSGNLRRRGSGICWAYNIDTMTTYSELVTQIREYTETDSNVFTTVIVNDFIEHAELRIFRDVDLDVFRKYQTASLTSGDAFVGMPGATPSSFSFIRSVNIFSPSGSLGGLTDNERRYLEKKTPLLLVNMHQTETAQVFLNIMQTGTMTQ